jgi:hypothetical protein
MKKRTAFWITFGDAKPACAWVETEAQARELAVDRGKILHVDTLPYPAEPRLDDKEGWGEGERPSFCYARSQCINRTACPQRISCTE